MLDAPREIYIFLAAFARIGTMLMMFPVFGEISVTPRVRLSIALAITMVLLPTVHDLYPPLPQNVAGLINVIFVEVFDAILLAGTVRLFTSALQVAGNLLGFQIGLSFAQSFDPTQGVQGALLGTFLSLTGVTLIVATDLHLLLLEGLHGSYKLFVPGVLPNLGDSSAYVLKIVGESFTLGVQMCTPFMVFGLVFYLGMGVLAKLMPQLQVFFIAMPANILLGLSFFMVLVGAMMSWYLAAFEQHVMPFAG